MDWNAIIIGAFAAAAALFSWMTKRQTSTVAQRIVSVEKNVEKVELATNSMKDALIRAAYIKGGEDERAKSKG